jgi:hypothetical protein
MDPVPFAALRLCVRKFSPKGVNVEIEELATVAVDCGFKLHRRLGPGLLESVRGGSG